jgi:hypothetical protein
MKVMGSCNKMKSSSFQRFMEVMGSCSKMKVMDETIQN